MMRRVTYLVLLLMFFAGCQRIPLYERSTKVNLVINIDCSLDHDIDLTFETELPKIYQDKINGVKPTHYEVLVYDVATDALVSSHIVGENGGTLTLFPGNYHFVLYNFGTESTQVSDLHHRMEAEAFTTDVTASKSDMIKSMSANTDVKGVSKAYEDDPIIYEPDHLYVANEMDILIEAFQGREEQVTIHSDASSIIDVYSLEVLNVKGVENIEKVEAFITGQFLSNYFGRQYRNESPATIYTEMTPDAQHGRLYTVFNTFGKLPGEENKIFLDITVTDSGGGQYRYIYDVTEQFDDPENTDHKLVVDGGDVDIPEASQGGGGFRPSVDEWEREEIDVPLG